MFLFLKDLLMLLLFISLTGYIVIVLIEKININRNIILIRNKHLSQDDINEIDISEFMFKGVKIRSGDEIKITTNKNELINGIIIGAKKDNNSIHIITHKNQVKKLEINNIQKFKIISKYGQFFNY